MKPFARLESGRRLFLLKDEKDIQRLREMIHSENPNAWLGTYISPGSYPVIAIETSMSILGKKSVACHYGIIQVNEIHILSQHE